MFKGLVVGAGCDQLFDIAVSDFDAKKSTHFSRLEVVNELDVKGIKCIQCEVKGLHWTKFGKTSTELATHIQGSNTFANTKIYSEQLVTHISTAKKNPTMKFFC